MRKEESQIKLIETRKFKEHMEVHKLDFINDYSTLFQKIRKEVSKLCNRNGFVAIVVEFTDNIGYSSINNITNTDNIIYAKRKGREIYSKFEIGTQKRLINKCVVILNQNKTNEDEYYLITIFPGDRIIKEIGDKNIRDNKELEEVNLFWSQNAFVYDPDIIDISTITKVNPYLI